MRAPFFSGLVSLTLLASCENEADEIVAPVQEDQEAAADDSISRFVGQYTGTVIVYDTSFSSGSVIADTLYEGVINVAQAGSDSTHLNFAVQDRFQYAANVDSDQTFYAHDGGLGYHRYFDGRFVIGNDQDSVYAHYRNWNYQQLERNTLFAGKRVP